MTTGDIVVNAFREEGLPPSAIDAMLKLPTGRAHDLIVAWWHEEKLAARRKGGEA